MRSFLITAILTSSALLLSAWPIPAQSLAQHGTWTATAFVHTSAGIRDPVTANDAFLADSIGAGVAVGYDWTPRFGFEGELSHLVDVAGNTTAVNWSISTFSANAVYHFDVRHVTPYATPGLGFARNSHLLKGARIADLPFRDRLGLDIPVSDVAWTSNEVAFDVGGGISTR